MDKRTGKKKLRRDDDDDGGGFATVLNDAHTAQHYVILFSIIIYIRILTTTAV